VDDLDTLTNLVPITTAAGAFLVAFMFLFRRGDSQQRDNLHELRRQRDEALVRADRCVAELASRDEAFDAFRAAQQQLRHDLQSKLQAQRMETELWRRRAVDAGWTGPEEPS
jgi:hypothetical protein